MTLPAVHRHDRHPGPMYPTADAALRRSVLREIQEAAASKPRFLDTVRSTLRTRHYSRLALLPAAVKPNLISHLGVVLAQHRRDLARGAGWVELPNAAGALSQ